MPCKTTDYFSIKWAPNNIPKNNNYEVNVWSVSWDKSQEIGKTP